jgi:hypothetical protein
MFAADGNCIRGKKPAVEAHGRLIGRFVAQSGVVHYR